MADSSFDVVSKVDRMELDNALNQASREVATRFDFKNPSQYLAPCIKIHLLKTNQSRDGKRSYLASGLNDQLNRIPILSE
jgi:uncharacterized protein YajQ (UPF0234 family)